MCLRAFAWLSFCLVFAGCAGSSTTPPLSPPAPTAGIAIKGSVHQGQHPVTGAHVYLLAANTTGYGNASVSLLNATSTGLSDAIGAYVTTDASGSFSIPGDYTCASNTQTYLYALGGNSGTGINSASGLLSLLGNCPSTAASATPPTVWINEVSTIAAAYAMAGFATDATHVSSSGTPLAQTGIANAFLNAANLASPASGAALATTPAGNGVVPQTRINTLANILAACVSSTGPASTPCLTLFSNALSGGSTGIPPTDTATAALNIVHNPGSNIAGLYALASSPATFAPALSAIPNDFTVAVQYTYPGFTIASASNLFTIAIDGSGNIWVPNNSTDSVTQLSSTGMAVSPSPGYIGGGLKHPIGIAIDGSGNAWVPNTSGPSITELSKTGAPISPASGYTDSALNNPLSVAIDPSGDAWVANESSGSITRLSPSGAVLSPPSGYTGGGLLHPASIAIASSGDVWLANGTSNNVSRFSNTGAPLSPASGYTGGGLVTPVSIAIDNAGDAWVANANSTTLSKLSSTGVPVSSSGYSGGGLLNPVGIAIDGSGKVWLANLESSISEFSSSGVPLSPSTGYFLGPLFLNAIAVDGSGDVWLSSDSSVVEIIGAATPVVTPIATGVKNNTLGTRP